MARHDRASARPNEAGDRELIYGAQAVRAVYDVRRDDILHVRRAAEVPVALAGLVRWADKRQIPHEILPDAELVRLSHSTHHEGIVIDAKPRTWTTPHELAVGLGLGVAIAVDGAAPPHDVGAIVRTAAFFGFDGVLVVAPAEHPGLTPAAVRMAHGGAERVLLARGPDLAGALDELARRGVAIVGVDARADRELGDQIFAPPVALVIGREREGLAPAVRAKCTSVVTIRGSANLDSLNIAVASGIVMAAVHRATAVPDHDGATIRAAPRARRDPAEAATTPRRRGDR